MERIAPPQRVGALVGVLGVIVGGLLVMLWGSDPIVADVEMPMLALAALFMIVEWRVIHIQFRAEASSFSLLEVPLVLGLLYAPPRELLLAAMLGMMLGLGVARRQPLLKVAFNVANIGLYCGVAWVIVDAAALTGDLGPNAWLSVFLATAVGSSLSVLGILAAITLTEGPPGLRPTNRLFGFALAMSSANTALGLLAALLLPIQVFSIALLLIPAAMVLLAFQMFASERAQRERVEFLYRSSRLLEADEAQHGPDALLEATREMFRAGVAALVLLPDDQSPASTIVLSGDRRIEIREVTSGREVSLIRAAFDALDEPRILDPLDEDMVAEAVRTVGGRDAIVARLATEDRNLGLLIVANRLGEVTSFTDDDLQVLGALAAQSGVLLHNDRLEQALVELRELEIQLAYQATHDTLTGLPNRSLFTRRLDEVASGSEPFAVLFMDLDDFKLVNDTRGHADGDTLLVEVADRIRTLLRPIDTAARLGGDEFAVLLREHPNPREVADRIVSHLSDPIQIGSSCVQVGCSVGIARSELGRGPQRLLQEADLAMYHAKRTGKRSVVEYEPGIEGQLEIGFKANLRDAISAGQLELHYQPVIDLGRRTVCGFEALVRWRSPELGLLLPGDFIDQAEHDGFIIPIDRWVLERAVTDLGRLCSLGHRDLFMAVNISARHLQAPDLVEFIRGLQPDPTGFEGRLLLEVTETALMGEIERSRSHVEAIRELGARFALDDFGTGYSSIGYLREFNIDVLKIAEPFVTASVESDRDHEFVGAMIELGHALGLTIVGEGIEHDDQARALRALGCEMGQGFLFARPVPFDEAIRIVDREHDRGTFRPAGLSMR